MEKVPKMDIHKGPTSNLAGIRKSVRKLEDSANAKVALLSSVRRIPLKLFVDNKFTPEDAGTFQSNLQKRLLKHSLAGAPNELRELTAECLRDTMRSLNIESPGFRDDFLEALDDIMHVDTHA